MREGGGKDEYVLDTFGEVALELENDRLDSSGLKVLFGASREVDELQKVDLTAIGIN